MAVLGGSRERSGRIGGQGLLPRRVDLKPGADSQDIIQVSRKLQVPSKGEVGVGKEG